MADKIFQTILSESSMKIIDKYGSIEKAPISKYKKFKKIIELIRKKKIIISPLFPGIADDEMKKYFSFIYDENMGEEVTAILSDNEIFESYYMKPSDDLPI